MATSSRRHTKRIVKKAAKKAAKRPVKKAAYKKKAAFRVSERVKGHARRILNSINEAKKIHKGDKEGTSFDDFLERF